MYRPSSACLGCEHSLPPAFLDLGDTPLANSYISPEVFDGNEQVYPLAVAFCPHCLLVQLTGSVAPDKLFSNYSYFSSYSSSFLEHARRLAESLAHRFRLNSQSRVLEIASNDGYLLQYLQRMQIPVLGIEPAQNIAQVAEERGIPTLNRFFDMECATAILEQYGPADVIVGNNVLAHVPRIPAFLQAVHRCLIRGGTAVFEFPYLLDLLRHREFDTIYHEHVFYYSLSAIDRLVRRANLHLVDVEHTAVHGGSLRIYLHRSADGSPARSDAVVRMLAEEEADGLTDARRFAAFADEVSEVKTQLVELLLSLRLNGSTVAAYGAPAKGNTLLTSCGIGRDLIDFTVDCSPHKQGRLLPGSHIPILHPRELLSRRPDYVLILPWNIAPEILAQQADYERAGGRFIVPIPTPRVLEGSRVHAAIESAHEGAVTIQ